MRIPKQLNVMGHTIKVRYLKKVIVDGKEVWGSFDPEKNIIYLCIGMDKTRRKEIFLHELVHAISEICVINLSEKAVKLLVLGLLSAIVNNKLNFLK